MPFVSNNIKLNEKQDRRRKLTSKQKEEIIRMYNTGVYSLRKLAKHYRVSHSTICLIVNPKRAERVKQRTKEHWRDYRPSNEEWAKTIREHRRYKQDLYLKGELLGDEGDK